MAEPVADGSRGPGRSPSLEDEFDRLPIDPDVDPAEDKPQPPVNAPQPFGDRGRSRWPRVHWRTVAMVCVGGFFGGFARYEFGLVWPSPASAFPLSTFTINTAGAFLLALILVLVLEVLPPTTFIRPALGTGFCGAFTTFSSVATSSDKLLAHGHAGTATAYVVVSVVAGLAAASFGILVGRSIAVNRDRQRGK